ncbi:beta-ketoacyl synthase N-terminal-like domain-containing protein [Micromonospora sp. BRA006-A]|nr:beta-ketoacyl synthase N-terminal-like domain-containing protein [Micromonospora sp. BRA006-A]
MSFAWFYAVNTGQLAIRHDMRGPVGVFVTDDAGGLDAIAHARRKIRRAAARC